MTQHRCASSSAIDLEREPVPHRGAEIDQERRQGARSRDAPDAHRASNGISG
jgi:hypothetical protein